jgi:hypothetical protein
MYLVLPIDRFKSIEEERRRKKKEEKDPAERIDLEGERRTVGELK